MKKKFMLTLVTTLLLSIGTIYADMESVETKIARAMSAAPSDISANATIVDVDGVILRKGTNGWTCLPGVSLIPGDKHPMCNDKVWMKWMKAAADGKTFSTNVIGVSYMLQGDGGVSNSTPYHADHMNAPDFIKEGPHLMIIVPKAVLKGITNDPHAGGPYVMWGETDYAHIMIPVTDRK